MILYLLFSVTVVFIGSVFSLFPIVTTLPWGVDETLIKAVSYYKFIGDVFPPFELFMSVTYLYLGYKFSKILLKAIMGSRMPSLT